MNVSYLLRLAQQGDSEAQNDLGTFYEEEFNYAEAFDWYKKAAYQGHTNANASLAYCYQNGFGIEQNLNKAVEHYTVASNNRHLFSTYSLAKMYLYGSGVSRDISRGERLLLDFASDPEVVNLYPIPSYIKEAYFMLGALYYQGIRPEVNAQDTLQWFRKAADLDHVGAQFNLGMIYNQGELVSQNHEEAIKWFKKAAENGDVTALYNVGQKYMRGEGIKKDYKEALKWFSLAAEKGDADAQYNLGAMYLEGATDVEVVDYNQGLIAMTKPIEKNIEKAVYWFTKSAAQGDESAESMLRKIRLSDF